MLLDIAVKTKWFHYASTRKTAGSGRKDNRNPHSLLMRIQNSMGVWVIYLEISHTAKHNIYDI